MSSHIIDLVNAFLLFTASGFYGYKRDWFKFLMTLSMGSILMNTLAILVGIKL